MQPGSKPAFRPSGRAVPILMSRRIAMDLRMRFNEDVVNYDRYRPTYCRELFEDIFSYAQLPAEAEVLEIGIGTGQGNCPFWSMAVG